MSEADKFEQQLEQTLEKYGSAEVKDGRIYSVTQAITEKDGKARYMMFGDVVECRFIPILEACAQCVDSFWEYFGSKEQCRESQRRYAVARGFEQVVCPKQFMEV